jgi:hypothetical protein
VRTTATAFRRGRFHIAILAALWLLPGTGWAWVDTNHNRIDDAIDAVNAGGWAAAFENGDPTRRMLIGVQNTTPITFAVYIGYDHKPNLIDQTALSATGVTMVWPFQSIDYIESRATYSRIQTIAALPGVTRVEAIPGPARGGGGVLRAHARRRGDAPRQADDRALMPAR